MSTLREFSGLRGAGHIAENLRNGNFYSVRVAEGYDGSVPDPHFQSIDRRKDEIVVKFRGASTIRFRDGWDRVVEHSGYDENDTAELSIGRFEIDGAERYVRVELSNSEDTTAYSQPIFIYGNSREDCIPFNPDTAEVRSVPVSLAFITLEGWAVIADTGVIAHFGFDEDAAQRAVAVIKHYQMDRQCFVGRPLGCNFEYFLANHASPEGSYLNEDCLSFDPDGLQVTFVNTVVGAMTVRSWKIVEGSDWLLDFGDSEIQARRALEIIKKHSFDHRCFVKRPMERCLGMSYFRR